MAEQEQDHEHGNIAGALTVYREGIELSFTDRIDGRMEVDDEGTVTMYVSDKELVPALKLIVEDGGVFYVEWPDNPVTEVKFEEES